MILFQVRDLAAKTCGEPHVAPSWEIARASLGAMLAKNPELAERSRSIVIEFCGEWSPECGITLKTFDSLGDQAFDFGENCLFEYRAACMKEEMEKQVEADNAE